MIHTEIPKDELKVFESITDIKVVFDVGARDDVDYLILKPGIELHAFEPDPVSFAELKDNVGNTPNVYLNNFGIGNIEGDFNFDGEITREQVKEPTKTSIQVKRLDNYIKEHGIKQIDFLKIDIEGFEWNALVGLGEMIKICRYIQYEQNGNATEIEDLLKKNGFKTYYTGYRNMLCVREGEVMPWIPETPQEGGTSEKGESNYLRRVYDCFSYNGEKDILEIRLNILYDFVDKFVIIEAGKTFAGHNKPYFFEDDKERFSKFKDKIFYYKVDEPLDNLELRQMALNSPLTGNKEEHWVREYLQKELPREALKELKVKDWDLVFFGDCDEIWNPEILKTVEGVRKIKQFSYYYYLNQRVNEEWWGTSYGKYGEVKGRTFNDWRGSPLVKMDKELGWHFTYQGGKEQLIRKVTSTDAEVCFGAPAEVLLARINGGKDLMERDFKYQEDETNWPEYLKEHKAKYQHLL